VAGRPVLNRLLANLYEQGVEEAVICAYGNTQQLREAAETTGPMRLEFLHEPLPVGNAGCIRDAYDGDKSTLFLVMQAAMLSPPHVSALVEAHRQSKSRLTVMLGSGSEVYVCEPDILKYMPAGGYFDMKEGLIASMVRAGQTVAARTLPRHTCSFRDRKTYLSASETWVNSVSGVSELLSLGLVRRSADLWLADSAAVGRDVTTHGPVVVMDNVRIASGAVIFGPTIIESGVTVGGSTVIDSSAVWPGAVLGVRCHISQCIVDRGAVAPDRCVVSEDVVLRKGDVRCGSWTNRFSSAVSRARLNKGERVTAMSNVR